MGRIKSCRQSRTLIQATAFRRVTPAAEVAILTASIAHDRESRAIDMHPSFPRARLRLRYNLKTLLVLVTVAASFCGWAYWQIKGLRRQRAEVEFFTARGANIITQPVLPLWLARALGDSDGKLFVRITAAHFRLTSSALGPPLVDEDLAIVGTWSSLERLVISHAKVTSEGLRHVARLRGLKDLRILHTPVNDLGLWSVRELKQLETLVLDGTQVTDEGLGHLAALRNLRLLSLEGTWVRGSGLRHLAKASHLEELWLTAGCDDAGLREIAAAAPRLRYLSASGGGITDAGLSALTALTGLRELKLEARCATAAALRDLVQIETLRRLEFVSAAIRDDALQDVTGMDRLESLGLPAWQLSVEAVDGFASRHPTVRLHLENGSPGPIPGRPGPYMGKPVND